MTEAPQKGVRKVNETRIKVHETNGDHHGYIEMTNFISECDGT